MEEEAMNYTSKQCYNTSNLLGIDRKMHKMVKSTILNDMFRVWSGLLVYNYQDDLAIWYKRTKNKIIAINNITLKKSLTYNKDGKNFIYAASPSRWSPAPCLMYNARCNKTTANIQKVNIM